MSVAKTAKLLNGLLDSQKTDRACIKRLEGRLAEVDIRQATAIAATVKTTEMQLRTQLDQVQQGLRVQLDQAQQELAAERAALTELSANKDWKITELTQELRTARQLLAAADASNVELQGIVETLGNNLDRATQAVANLADERAEIDQKREALNHLLDEVRAHMRKKDLVHESAILNRAVLARAVPGINRK